MKNSQGKNVGRVRLLCGSLLAGAAFVLSLPSIAFAQSGDSSEAQSTEPAFADIVVTANRSEQKLQRVGIAVTALSSDDLVAKGISQTTDLAVTTPGLQIAIPSGAAFSSLISIRGVSQNDFAGHLESPNTFYIDDAYQPIPSMTAQPLFDVKRVEVLKGPQGTLFGRNSAGGLVNVLTNDPGDEAEGYVQGDIGNYNSVIVQGALNAPLSENVSARLAFYKSYMDGLLKNDIGPDSNPDNSLGIRGKVKIDATDRLTILFSADYFQYRAKAAGAAYIVGGTPDPVTGLGTAHPGSPTFFGYVDADGDPFTIHSDYPGFLRRDNWSVGAKLTYDAGPVTIVSQTSRGHASSHYGEDNDNSELDWTRFFQGAGGDFLTQELRLNRSTLNLRWTAGAYYLNLDGGPYGQRFDFRAAGAALETHYRLKTSSWSVFAQAEFDLSSMFTLVGGVRFTRDHKKFRWSQACIDSTPSILPIVPGGYCAVFFPVSAGTQGSVSPYADQHNENGVSGKVELDFKPTDQILVYASYNRGYKAFSYNTGFAGVTPVSGILFKGERPDAYELGTKITFFDGKARFNAAGFYYDYHRYQAFDQRSLNLTLYNTSATIKGLEGEIALRPGGGFDLSLGATYLDTKVDDVPLLNGSVSRQAPQSPKYTLMGSIGNSQPLLGGEVTAQFNGILTGSQYSQLTNAPATRVPSNFVGNVRLSYQPHSGAFVLAVWSKNVFNDKTPRYAFDLTGAPLGFAEYNMGMPRTAGASVRVNF